MVTKPCVVRESFIGGAKTPEIALRKWLHFGHSPIALACINRLKTVSMSIHGFRLIKANEHYLWCISLVIDIFLRDCWSLEIYLCDRDLYLGPGL